MMNRRIAAGMAAIASLTIRTIICPKENEKDLKDIPKEVVKDLKILLVDHVDQVLVNALELKNAKELFKARGERGSGLRAQYTGHTQQETQH